MTAAKETAASHLDHLNFLESLDRINRAMQKADGLDQMMSDVLDEALDIFDCDRAALVNPCDPESATWSVLMERTRPEFPGMLALGIELPTEAEAAAVFRALLDADGPVGFGRDASYPLPARVAEHFNIRSQLAMSIHPKGVRPWMFVIHQCSYERVWSSEETRLFQEIGRRVADGLTSLLIMRDLRESEEKYRRFIETSNEGICALDGNSRVTYANDKTFAMIGYSSDEMLGRPLSEFMFEEDVAGYEPRRAARRRGLSENYEYRFRRKDGSELWLLISASSIHDQAGSFQGSFAMFSDITERKRAEAKLALSEEKFSIAFHASPNLMAITRPEDGYIVEINESFCRFFGYTREECIGHNTAELRMWADPAQREIVIQKLKEAGAALYMPVDLRTKSGEIRSVIDSLVFIEIENQKYLLSVVTDVTERKRAEEQLRENLVGTIRAFSLTVEKRDPYTAGHQARVSRLCTAIGEKLGLDAERIEGLRLGAMVHDIGNVYVPAEILSRPGRLKDLEFAIVKSHAQIGHEIVNDIKFPWPVADMILQHHERMDGSGYPNGLKAPDILLEARIIAVADVIEAMMSHRPYRAALGVDAAMREIEANRGTKYDPEVVHACLSLFRDDGFSFD
jgi:PAS domain S-box-containing protein/putative nucleotidyltransferase with HDIG domain